MTEHPNTAEAPAKPAGEAGAADSDIAALLNEFDDKSAPKPAETPATTQPRTSARTVLEKLSPLVEYVETKRAQEVKEGFDKSVNEAVAQIKADDALKSMPDPFVRGYLHDYAQQNPIFDKAFRERGQNPAAWSQALDKARSAAAETMKGTAEPKVTETLAAARAAVAGDTPTVPNDSDKPDNAKLNSMSDSEFERYKRGLAAKNSQRR